MSQKMWIFGDTASRTSYVIYSSLNLELISLWIHRLCTCVSIKRNYFEKRSAKTNKQNRSLLIVPFKKWASFALCSDTFLLLSQQPEWGERGNGEDDEETKAKYNRQINKQARRNIQPLVCHTLDSFIPQLLNNKHPSSHKVSLFSRLRNFFLFSLFNNFISCFRREEVLLSLFPVFYSCCILSSPSFVSLVTLSASSLARTSHSPFHFVSKLM